MLMHKIAIIGCGGAGKSTFSRKLAEVLDIPRYHLDALFWKSGWIPTSKDESSAIINELIEKQEWIIN